MYLIYAEPHNFMVRIRKDLQEWASQRNIVLLGDTVREFNITYTDTRVRSSKSLVYRVEMEEIRFAHPVDEFRWGDDLNQFLAQTSTFLHETTGQMITRGRAPGMLVPSYTISYERLSVEPPKWSPL